MKVKLWKIKHDYKIFKEGTIFEEILDIIIVQNEWSKGVNKDYFEDLKLKATFSNLMERVGTKDFTECNLYKMKIKYWENELKILERKIELIKESRKEFLQKYDMTEKDIV